MIGKKQIALTSDKRRRAGGKYAIIQEMCPATEEGQVGGNKSPLLYNT